MKCGKRGWHAGWYSRSQAFDPDWLKGAPRINGNPLTSTTQSSGRPPPTWGGVGEPPAEASNLRMPCDGVEGWFLEWVKIGLNWVRFQFLKKAKMENSPMFINGFAFFELGSFSRFCVFTRGGWPQRHRDTEGCDAHQWEQGW
jgi:hypothetical protein